MHPSLSLITLGVTDVDRSLAFYKDTLGWKTDAKPGDPVAFFPLSSGVVLGLFGRNALAEDAKVKKDGKGFAGFSLAQNLSSKAEVDALFAELKAKGVHISKPPEDVFWGGYSGYFTDPDGYLWEVAWNPFWTVQENGSVTLGA